MSETSTTDEKASPASPGSAIEFRQLVDDFGNAALKAGQSNSGYAFDATGHWQWENMQKLRARLHALAPLFDSPND